MGPPVSWDQVVTWFIIPGVMALVRGLGGIWLPRRIP